MEDIYEVSLMDYLYFTDEILPIQSRLFYKFEDAFSFGKELLKQYCKCNDNDLLFYNDNTDIYIKEFESVPSISISKRQIY